MGQESGKPKSFENLRAIVEEHWIRLAFILLVFAAGYGVGFTDVWSPIRLFLIPLFPVIGYGIIYNTARLFCERNRFTYTVSLITLFVSFVAFFSLRGWLQYNAYIILEENIYRFYYLKLENNFHFALYLSFFLGGFLSVFILRLLNSCKRQTS